jgi:hypothetical protein
MLLMIEQHAYQREYIILSKTHRASATRCAEQAVMAAAAQSTCVI